MQLRESLPVLRQRRKEFLLGGDRAFGASGECLLSSFGAFCEKMVRELARKLVRELARKLVNCDMIWIIGLKSSRG
jgi:hypothetical protein